MMHHVKQPLTPHHFILFAPHTAGLIWCTTCGFLRNEMVWRSPTVVHQISPVAWACLQLCSVRCTLGAKAWPPHHFIPWHLYTIGVSKERSGMGLCIGSAPQFPTAVWGTSHSACFMCYIFSYGIEMQCIFDALEVHLIKNEWNGKNVNSIAFAWLFCINLIGL